MDNPFAPWNNPIYKNDLFAPWNNPMHKDDPFAPWNNSFSHKEDLEKYEKEHGLCSYHPDYNRW